MSPFSVIVTPSSIAFTALNGKPYNITTAHPSFTQIKELVQLYRAAPENAEEIRAEMDRLAEPAKVITAAGQGRLYVHDGVVMFNKVPIHNAVTDRIIWGLAEGYAMDSYLHFLDKLMDNPSKRAVDELYGFIETHKMGIADDGDIIAYKKVRENYHDIYTGKFDNTPGQILDMPRNGVDDDRNRTCSDGFHFCAFEYLSKFGSGRGDRVVIVKVNPRDVVSIPSDHNDAKARCCHYEVIGEYTGDDLQDVLGNRPVWSDKALDKEFDWERGEYEDDKSTDDTDCPYCGEEIGYCSCEDDDSDDGFTGFDAIDDMFAVTNNPEPESYSVTDGASGPWGELSNQSIDIMTKTKAERTKREGHYIIKVEMGETITLLGGQIDVSRVIWDDGTETYVSSDEEDDLYASLREQAAAGHKARVVVK